MRAVRQIGYGGPEVLTAIEVPAPEAGPGRLRIRVRAASVNPVDWMTRAGLLQGMTPHLSLPLTLGWDLAGEVETAAGDFTVGQRVVAMVPWFEAGNGTNAELVVVDPAWVATVPVGVDVLDHATAATLPLNGLTARQSLDLLQLRAGQSLLVTGASGAVGGFAVQLASAAGIRVVAVASAGDEGYVRGLGAVEVLGRADPETQVRAARGLFPDGLDGVLDAVPHGPVMLGAVRDGGAYLTVLDPLPAAERGIRTARVGVVPDAAQLNALAEALVAGTLRTRVADVLPLADAARAHKRVAAGGMRGRIVLAV